MSENNTVWNSAYSPILLIEGRSYAFPLLKCRGGVGKPSKEMFLLFLKQMNKSSICFSEDKWSSKKTETVPKPLKYDVTDSLTSNWGSLVTNTSLVRLKADHEFARVAWTFLL